MSNKILVRLRITLYSSWALYSFSVGARDVNITNITHAESIPTGSFFLGTTGNVTRLFPSALVVGGSQVWTNHGKYIWPSGQPEPVAGGATPGPAMFFTTYGSLYQGTNVMADQNDTPGTVLNALIATTMVTSNEPPRIQIFLDALDSEDYNYWAGLDLVAKTEQQYPYSQIRLVAQGTNLIQNELNVFARTDFDASPLLVPFIIALTNNVPIGKFTRDGMWSANSFRRVDASAPADVGGITYNLTVVTNGTDTVTIHITNGVIMSITAP